MITIEEALHTIDNAIQPERLNSVQELILTQCWSGKTYQEIAEVSGYDPDYIRVVGSRLWQLLSEAFGEKITKNNFRSVLRQKVGKVEDKTNTGGYISSLELPETPVPLDSTLYIQRPPSEVQAYEEIAKPGALIRIKGPKQMGKSSLVMRILAHAQARGYSTVRLNLLQAEDSVISNLERLLRWFCANITLQLGLESLLDDYWDEDLGFKVSCTTYLQGYVLGQLDSPLVVALDEVNRLFSFPEVAQEFLPLLRFWHEEANNVRVWQKYRSVVTHSTEIYIPLSINQSPFNVGLAISLDKFTWEQAQELVKRYGLDRSDPPLTTDRLKSLYDVIEGHPYLMNLALCHLVTKENNLAKILEEATTETSIYRDHLRGHLVFLQQNPELEAAFKTVVTSTEPVNINSLAAYKLESTGLLTLQGNYATPMCDLYRVYFRDRL